jgi:cytochrome c-type biogenesis protein CcmF
VRDEVVIAELGHFALVLALAVAFVQFAVPLYGAERRQFALMQLAQPAALTQLTLLVAAFAALMHAYLVSDFSLANVVANSHSEKPTLYKIAGVWGNHEGSMLLWVLILAVFGAAVALFGGNLPVSLKSRVLAVQGAIGFAFLLFMVTASNPFERLDPPPIEGRGLNPLLQDPALAFHPPFLYAGYVGLSIAFAFALAALIEGRLDAAWARWVRPWTLAAWMFLTIGIAMGSWWAYYELGWGGWWFWDPVENASFMPWLAATALLHSAIVVEKRNALKIWTILLSILAFSLSLVGTFLVRSGVLTSVHAFAVDPERGVFILGILSVFIGGSLALFAWRAPAMKAGGLFAPVSREGGLVVNNLLLCASCAAVFIGTLYPLALETLTGEKISVGPPYFNLTFGPIILPLLLLVPLGPMLTWKRADAVARAIRHGARHMADPRKPDGTRRAYRALPQLRLVRPPDRPAAFGTWHDHRPCGARRHGHRHRRDQRVERGTDPRRCAGRAGGDRGLFGAVQGRGAGIRTELLRRCGALRGAAFGAGTGRDRR